MQPKQKQHEKHTQRTYSLKSSDKVFKTTKKYQKNIQKNKHEENIHLLESYTCENAALTVLKGKELSTYSN